jgi:hypothetical protein
MDASAGAGAGGVAIAAATPHNSSPGTSEAKLRQRRATQERMSRLTAIIKRGPDGYLPLAASLPAPASTPTAAAAAAAAAQSDSDLSADRLRSGSRRRMAPSAPAIDFASVFAPGPRWEGAEAEAEPVHAEVEADAADADDWLFQPASALSIPFEAPAALAFAPSPHAQVSVALVYPIASL